MHKIKFIGFNFNNEINGKKIKYKKIIEINDNLFEIGLRKGLIEKDEDEYFFIGEFEDFLAFINKSSHKSFRWLD